MRAEMEQSCSAEEMIYVLSLQSPFSSSPRLIDLSQAWRRLTGINYGDLNRR